MPLVITVTVIVLTFLGIYLVKICILLKYWCTHLWIFTVTVDSVLN
uniref:Uncharacterized protein n=1 Tax=Rhizophora mucronata TaxID=61149 RepID=A0A2P2MYW0_RHIMU